MTNGFPPSHDSRHGSLAVRYVPIASLTPDPRNARTHSKLQIEQVAASISQFGFTNPILAEPSGKLIAGHARLLAAKKMGLHEVPVIILSGLSESQTRALRIADNKIALSAGWDLDILKIELTELGAMPDLEFELGITGFSGGEIDVILSGSPDPQDEVIPATPLKPQARLGDIWALGGHRIGCGDCRDVQFLRAVVGENVLVDAAFMDPPYNVKINGNVNAKGRHREFAMASGEMSNLEFVDFLASSLGTATSVSRPGAVHFVCMDWRHLTDVTMASKGIYDELLNICVWNKSNAGMGSLYRSKHEMIFVYRVPGAMHTNAVELGKHGRNRTNIWDYPSVNSFKGSRRRDLALHPTVKPVAMVADAFQDVTRHGDLVLDLFLGSGTSLIAAERAGRRFRGIEIDPAYIDVAIERWGDLTGMKCELVHRAGEAA